MKKAAFLFVFLLFISLHSCYFGESVTGNGKVVTEEREVYGFDALKVENGIDVFITSGEEERLSVEADENLHEYIMTEVRNGELKIFSNVNIRMAKSKKIHLTYKSLQSIRISSAGDVYGMNTLQTDHLRVNLSSAGNLKLDVDAEEIFVDISSSGNVSLSGSTGYLKADLSSAGDLHAFDLEARNGDIHVSSAGNARVYLTESGNFNASSAGDIIYMGNPLNVRVNTSSAGKVKKR
jgi:hypothetical protein